MAAQTVDARYLKHFFATPGTQNFAHLSGTSHATKSAHLTKEPCSMAGQFPRCGACEIAEKAPWKMGRPSLGTRNSLSNHKLSFHRVSLLWGHPGDPFALAFNLLQVWIAQFRLEQHRSAHRSREEVLRTAFFFLYSTRRKGYRNRKQA